MLQRLATQLQAVFRHTDLICRYGGEEFVVAMPGADRRDARRCGAIPVPGRSYA